MSKTVSVGDAVVLNKDIENLVGEVVGSEGEVFHVATIIEGTEKHPHIFLIHNQENDSIITVSGGSFDLLN